MLPTSTATRRPFILVLLVALVLAALGLAIQVNVRGNDSADRLTGRAIPVLPRPELQLVKPLTVEDAIQTNETRPVMSGGLEAAPIFSGKDLLSDPIAHRSALDCLTAAVYYEAGSESLAGQRAVAQVVLNRVRHPAFPSSVCAVVYQGSARKTGCQFTFTCDGSLMRRPSRMGWSTAREVAAAALAGRVEPSAGMATHYHANWVVPYWADSLDKIAVIGGHIFYRWRGFWGRRQAFNQRYSGQELPEALAHSPVVTDLGVISTQPPNVAHTPSPLSHLQADLVEAPLGRPREDDRSPMLQADETRPVLVLDDMASADTGTATQ